MTISEPTLKSNELEPVRRFGKYGLDMEDLPDPLVPKPLPFELPL
jgi:hypothetical protein